MLSLLILTACSNFDGGLFRGSGQSQSARGALDGTDDTAPPPAEPGNGGGEDTAVIPSGVASIEIELPSEPFEISVNEPFVLTFALRNAAGELVDARSYNVPVVVWCDRDETFPLIRDGMAYTNYPLGEPNPTIYPNVWVPEPCDSAQILASGWLTQDDDHLYSESTAFKVTSD